MRANDEFMLKDHPRPNVEELSELYVELDDLIFKAEKLIRGLPSHIFIKEKETILFEKMTQVELEKLIDIDPSTMVIAFTRVCGLSDREYSRLFCIKNVYKLRKSWRTNRIDKENFIKAIRSLLPKRMFLETFLYTFYKMWEEDQKRHHRAKFEGEVRMFFRKYGYDCKKITKPLEVNGAIPSNHPQVVIQVRTGVRKDLVKRAKEFSSEFDRSIETFPHARFIIIFKIPTHELDRRENVKQVINAQRQSQKPYDALRYLHIPPLRIGSEERLARQSRSVP